MGYQQSIDQLPEILRCPITKSHLKSLPPEEVERVNDRITKGEIAHLDGSPIQTRLEAGLITVDGRYVYPVIEGIFVLLENLAIPLVAPGNQDVSRISLQAEKKILQDFYDQIGWHNSGEGESTIFNDALKWEDLRPVASEYIHNCHLRINRHIKNRGQFLLDAGSGPVQYPDYLTYSEGYQFRLCLDLSFLALREAKKKLGEKGIYILGDITNIPLQDNSVDSAVSLHVIYHVPKDEQVKAICEIYRVLRPETSAAIIYSWPKSTLMDFFLFHRKIRKVARHWIQNLKSIIKSALRVKRHQAGKQSGSAPETPYHYTFNQDYFTTHLKGMDLRILVWRSVSVPFMRTYIHPWLFGSSILRWIYRLEERSPSVYGRIGQYPLFIIRKLSFI